MDDIAGNEPIVSGQDDTTGINPAWNEALSGIPEAFHQQLTPHFQKWDQSANSRIEELNGQLKNWEPYGALTEHGITMDQVTDGLRIMQELNQNPKAIYDALTEHYGWGSNPAQAADPNNIGTPPVAEQTPFDLKSTPEYNQLQEQLNLVSQLMVQEQQAKQHAAEDAKLNNEINSALEKFSDVQLTPDVENFILSQMEHKGKTADQAFQSFVDFRNSLQPAPFAPNVLSANGGGVPSQAINTRNLSDADTKALIVQMLKAQNGVR
jgi:hypothetical protein